jgi:hypothetical protein
MFIRYSRNLYGSPSDLYRVPQFLVTLSYFGPNILLNTLISRPSNFSFRLNNQINGSDYVQDMCSVYPFYLHELLVPYIMFNYK